MTSLMPSIDLDLVSVSDLDLVSDSEWYSDLDSDLDAISDSKLITYISKTLTRKACSTLSEHAEPESKLIIFITRIVSVLSSRGSELSSKFISLSMKVISLVSSMDLDTQQKPESELISLIKQIISFGNSVSDGWGHESQVVSLVTQMISLTTSVESDPEQEMMPLVPQIFYHLDSMNSDSELISLIAQIVSLAHRKYTELNPKIRRSIIELFSCRHSTYWDAKFLSYVTQIISSFKSFLTPEWNLKSFIRRLIFSRRLWISEDLKLLAILKPLFSDIISLVRSMDLDSQPKPEAEVISLIKQIIFLVNSTDLDSQQKPELKVMSLIKQLFSHSVQIPSWPRLLLEMKSLIFSQDFSLVNSIDERERELMSLIYQIFSLVISMDTNLKKCYSLSPEAQVRFEKGKFHVIEGKISWNSDNKWKCLPFNWECFRFPGDEDFELPGNEDYYTHFHCPTCNGENHKEFNKVRVEIKHPLHPKHYLQLVKADTDKTTRVCYCCDTDLRDIFYYCSGCDYAINIACVEKPPISSIEHSKWHEQHSLALFPRLTSLNCSVCALTHSSCPIYMCPPCDFVVHQKCINLPHVIKISRHGHRIKFTPSFDRGDRCCSICRRKINNDYGGYSCIKKECLYVTHTRCGTQKNVWDGIDLEGVPEEVEEEELPPFVTISEGIIEHFSHQNHYLRFDQNIGRDYDENKLCEACVMPIYIGNIYSCMKCDFILHEKCANYPRKIAHPIHPHLLTLVNGATEKFFFEKLCSACPSQCTAGYFYKCDKERCDFTVHVGCGTITEPLDHPSHMHSLFLTSKPKEEEDGKICSVCKNSRHCHTHETFNCIEEECDFALCFGCATLPQKVRYKHDNHVLTLSYGDETSTMTYWCEICEGKLNPKERFYGCDEYCCVTLHINCMLGDLYMKPGSRWLSNKSVRTLPNNHMSRPVCIECRKHCPHKVFFEMLNGIYCSSFCLLNFN